MALLSAAPEYELTALTAPWKEQQDEATLCPNDEESMSNNNNENSTALLLARSLDSFLEEAYNNATDFSWKYWFVIASLGIANASDASEILSLSYILTNESFEDNILLHSAWRGSLLASTVFFGMLLGGLFVGTLGDIAGRRSVLLTGLWCNAVAGVVSAAAQDVYQLALLRAVAGIGIGASIPPLFTLATELAPPSKRGFFITLVASFWMIGAIYVAVVALLTMGIWSLSWRVFAIACAVPTTLGAILVGNLVPESPRFLALGNRQEEALVVINNLGRQMKFDGPLMTREEIEELYPPTITNTGPDRTGSCACSWRDLPWTAMYEIFQRDQLRTTLSLQAIWFALSFGSYGILTWINTLFEEIHLENPYFNAMLFALANLPGNIGSALLVDRIGRRNVLFGSAMGGALSLLGFAFVTRNQGSNESSSSHTRHDETVGIVVAACLFQAFVAMAWNTIDTLSSELFPTTVRSTGMGVCAATGRIGALVAQVVNGSLLGHPVALLTIASAFLGVSAVVPFALPGRDMSYQPLVDNIQPTTEDSLYDTVDDDGTNGVDDDELCTHC